MSHVEVHHRVYLGAGHHRQPRNPQPWVEPYGGSGYDALPGGSIHETAFDTLAFTYNGSPAVANFVFWSVSSASVSTTQTATSLTQTATGDDLTLIAWYYLPPGGPGGGEGTAELIDAYSVTLGTFIDDTFVTVTSDPSLTSEANVVGEVPSTVAETVDAIATVSTGETFAQWLIEPGDPSTASGTDLHVPAHADGFAYAVYEQRNLKIPAPPQYTAGGFTILYGIVNDAAGVILVNGRPVPVDPGWGTLIKQQFVLAGVAAESRKLPAEGTARLTRAVAQELGTVAQHLGTVAQHLGATVQRGLGERET